MKLSRVTTSLLATVLLASCSTSEYSSNGGSLRATRLSGTGNGDFNASTDLSNDVTAASGDAAAVPPSSSTVPTKEGVSAEGKTEADKLDDAIMGACLEKLNPGGNFQSYKVVDVDGKNKNNSTLHEDLVTSEASLILLRISLKNVNNSDLKLLNPKSTYCIDMQVKNMNKFRFEIACESKVGFIRLEKKNSNNMSTTVVPVACE